MTGAPEPAGPGILIEQEDGVTRARLAGDVAITTLADLHRGAAPIRAASSVTLDLAAVAHLDTAGAWLVAGWIAEAEGRGATVEVTGASPLQHELIATVRQHMTAEAEAPPAPFSVSDALESLGRRIWRGVQGGLSTLSFLGEVVAKMGRILLSPGRLRLTSLVHHMQRIGIDAIPIVSLMAFLIGVVLAFQGASQLRQFGAEVFVVDLIAISILRELGILLTAIIVAGRTGAAFTAAIGSMKMREEIDAMRTLSLDPVEVLVVPRVLALMLTLPILGLIAALMGLIGGAVMSWIELGVSPGVFRTRLIETVDVWHYLVGIIKAPVFAVIIGVTGCYQGMQVGGDAESLGRLTSRSVVVAIFTVIVADALFSIFFAIVGV